MTYAELKQALGEFTEAQLQQDVTIYVHGVGEWYPLMKKHPIVESGVDDVLDEGTKYLVI